MVSKIAVMALVAVVAVPILLGYGLNINTESRQVWAENDDPLDAKDYLMTTFDATGATYTDADTYQMNTNIFYRDLYLVGGVYQKMLMYPNYQSSSFTSTNTALRLDKALSSTTFDLWTNWGFSQFVVNGTYDAGNYYTIKTYNNGAHLLDYDHVKYGIFDDGVLFIYWYDSYGYGHSTRVSNVTNIQGVPTGIPNVTINFVNSNGPYVDLTKGYRLNLDGAVWSSGDPDSSSGVESTYMEISESTKSMLITFDLSTITESTAMLYYGNTYLSKTTTGDGVKWQYGYRYADMGGSPVQFYDMYYNPLASSNTYQLMINADGTRELNYIGGWPANFGSAPAMLTYSYNCYYYPSTVPPEHISQFAIRGQTPLMRVDYSRVGAYDYRVMEDAVYDPAAFRANPITTLTNGLRFGPSLEFGGNTYQVTKGNITIGTHDFSLEGMEFESVQVGGQYENRIDGNTVSTTAAPSTITFNGKWLTDVTTESQSMETVSDTKWEPGKFAWNGIDTDFKIAGLMASLGAFVALAIYGRRSGAKVLPLLLVCGGAAFMFLLMI